MSVFVFFTAAAWNKKLSVSQPSVVLFAGKATISLAADNVVQASVNSPGLPSMHAAFHDMACL